MLLLLVLLSNISVWGWVLTSCALAAGCARFASVFDRRSQQRLSNIRQVARFVQTAFRRSINTRQDIAAAIEAANQVLHRQTTQYQQYH